MRIVLADTTASGTETARLLLDDVPSPIRLRDLICHRVREEVARYNANPVPQFNGLVQPTDAERTLNGHVLRVPRALDWRAPAEAARPAVGRHRVLVIPGEPQG